jgi:hypothetical protein
MTSPNCMDHQAVISEGRPLPTTAPGAHECTDADIPTINIIILAVATESTNLGKDARFLSIYLGAHQ